MPKIPIINGVKLIKVLKKSGFMLNRINGSHLITYLLSKQILASKEKFIQEGGLNEQLYKARTKQRGF